MERKAIFLFNVKIFLKFTGILNKINGKTTDNKVYWDKLSHFY